MWLCTKYGFYSIVQKQPGEYHIRARVKRDLENLKAGAEIKKRIIVTKDADYPYRIVGIRADVIIALAYLADTINYSNFKAEIAKTEDQRDKLPAYQEIGLLTAKFQKRRGKK